MAISSISSAMAYGVYGVRNAIDRADTAAANVVNSAAALSADPSTDTATFSPGALDRARAASSPEASLAQGLVDQNLSSHQLTANVRVIQTADEMMSSLMQIGQK